ncbi:RNA-directed DNA polymerase, eukaryota, reverse transcriptase zinc-binding domain protein [Tanacetum coccineum]
MKSIPHRWKWTSNGSICSKGSRIILGWNDDIVDVMIMAQTNQVMHVQINIRADNKSLFCSFIYADNYYVDRHALWNNLTAHASLMRDKPWALLGDFNVALNLEDHSCGGYEPNIAIREFKEIMCNILFNNDFPGSFAIFQPYRISDHSLCVLRIPKVSKPKHKPFKFSNFLVYKEGFRDVVDTGWNLNVNGCAMYRVVKQLKGLKTPLRKLLHNQGNLHDRVNHLRVELDEAQKAIDRNPSCSLLRDEHAHYLMAFKEASLDEERFLRQKSKIEWLNVGDFNTAYFYKIVKRYYHPFDDHVLFSRVLADHKAEFMVWEVSDSEIKGALFSMGDDKAPGPDGFIAAFLKKAWDIVGDEVMTAIKDFFSNKLMRNYHRKRGPPRCAFKVDIQKAYDTVDWGFLRSILVGFGFHPTMVEWIMVYVTTISYSVCINGDIHGWFNGKRGLRQGDPLSSYLFTLVMEVLTLILHQRGQNAEDFQYHHLCEQQRIVNLCFADDLFLFTRGHPNFVRVIIDALEEFKNVSGLVPSILKSTAFFCNVSNALNDIILSSMSFVKGEMKKGKAKVAWEAICLPQREGGLGIRRIEDFNIALISTHIWCILINKESLWVQWIHLYKLKGRSFWDVPCLGDASWGWRKLLQIRPHVYPFIWHKINNGRSTSIWFDRWVDPCLLRDMLTVRNIIRSGFSLSNTVSDLISNGSWRWPHDWLSRFLNVFNILVSDINNSLRLRADVIDWYHVVWFPHCIPRHAIHLWLVIKEKLKTQDRLRQWDVGPSIDLNLLKCPLCDMVTDSHSHLFFECSFASQVWFQVRVSTSMSSIPPRFVDVLAFLIQSKGSSVSNVISRLVLAAMTYCLWNERNSRLFKKKKSTTD